MSRTSPPDNLQPTAAGNSNGQHRLWLELLGAAILVAGLAAAAWIISTTPDVPTGTIGYTMVDGQAYPVTGGDDKVYRHELERIGGKSALLVDDFSRWFASWWHGRRLALTLVLLAGASALLCFWLAEKRFPKSDRKPPADGQS